MSQQILISVALIKNKKKTEQNPQKKDATSVSFINKGPNTSALSFEDIIQIFRIPEQYKLNNTFAT